MLSLASGPAGPIRTQVTIFNWHQREVCFMAGRNIPIRYSASKVLAGIVILAGMTCSNGHAQQPPLPTIPPQPLKMFTIQGQVSLPDGRPAVHVLVTLSSSATRRQTYTLEQGRFEFPSM